MVCFVVFGGFGGPGGGFGGPGGGFLNLSSSSGLPLLLFPFLIVLVVVFQLLGMFLEQVEPMATPLRVPVLKKPPPGPPKPPPGSPKPPPDPSPHENYDPPRFY